MAKKRLSLAEILEEDGDFSAPQPIRALDPAEKASSARAAGNLGEVEVLAAREVEAPEIVDDSEDTDKHTVAMPLPPQTRTIVRPTVASKIARSVSAKSERSAKTAGEERSALPDTPPPGVGSADVGSADVGSADVGSADVGSADVGSADVGSPEECVVSVPTRGAAVVAAEPAVPVSRIASTAGVAPGGAIAVNSSAPSSCADYVKISVTLPPEMHEALLDLARNRRRARAPYQMSHLVREALAEWLPG